MIPQAKMSDIPVLQGDVITGKYLAPSQAHSISILDCIRTGKTTPYLIYPYLFPENNRAEKYLEAK